MQNRNFFSSYFSTGVCAFICLAFISIFTSKIFSWCEIWWYITEQKANHIHSCSTLISCIVLTGRKSSKFPAYFGDTCCLSREPRIQCSASTRKRGNAWKKTGNFGTSKSTLWRVENNENKRKHSVLFVWHQIDWMTLLKPNFTRLKFSHLSSKTSASDIA